MKIVLSYLSENWGAALICNVELFSKSMLDAFNSSAVLIISFNSIPQDSSLLKLSAEFLLGAHPTKKKPAQTKIIRRLLNIKTGSVESDR